MIRFVAVLISTGLLIAATTATAHRLGWIDVLPSYFIQTLILLSVTTIIIYAYLYRLKNRDFFVQLYLLTIAIKILAYGAYNAIMIIYDNAGAPRNVVFFMTVYGIFTALEIAFLYRRISGKTPQ